MCFLVIWGFCVFGFCFLVVLVGLVVWVFWVFCFGVLLDCCFGGFSVWIGIR